MDFKSLFTQRLQILLGIVIPQWLNEDTGSRKKQFNLIGISCRLTRLTGFLLDCIVYLSVRQKFSDDESMVAISLMNQLLSDLIIALKNYHAGVTQKRIFDTKEAWAESCWKILSIFKKLTAIIVNDLRWRHLNGCIERTQAFSDSTDFALDVAAYESAFQSYHNTKLQEMIKTQLRTTHNFLQKDMKALVEKVTAEVGHLRDEQQSLKKLLLKELSEQTKQVLEKLQKYHEDSKIHRETIHVELVAGRKSIHAETITAIDNSRKALLETFKDKFEEAFALMKEYHKISQKERKEYYDGLMSHEDELHAKAVEEMKSLFSEVHKKLEELSVSIKQQNREGKRIKEEESEELYGLVLKEEVEELMPSRIVPIVADRVRFRQVQEEDPILLANEEREVEFLKLEMKQINDLQQRLQAKIMEKSKQIDECCSNSSFSPMKNLAAVFGKKTRTTQPKLCEMQMTSFIRHNYIPAKWFPILVYIHSNNQTQKAMIQQLASSILLDDKKNYEQIEDTASQRLPVGAEIFILATLDMNTVAAGGKISPSQHTLIWNTEINGEQFFVHIPNGLPEDKEVIITVQYLHQGVILSSTQQTLQRQSTSIIENKEGKNAPSSNKKLYMKTLIVYDDNDETVIKQNYSNESFSSVQYLSITQVKDYKNKSTWTEWCDMIQFYFSSSLCSLESISTVQTMLETISSTTAPSQTTVPIDYSFCLFTDSNSEIPTIPTTIRSFVKNIILLPFTKATKEITKAINDTKQYLSYPIYSFIFNKKLPFIELNSPDTNNNIKITGKKKEINPMIQNLWSTVASKLSVKAHTSKDKNNNTSVFVSFFCEDPECINEGEKSTKLIHEPLEISIPPEILPNVKPYLQYMRRLLQDYQESSQNATTASFPFSIPRTQDIFDSEYFKQMTAEEKKEEDEEEEEEEEDTIDMSDLNIEEMESDIAEKKAELRNTQRLERQDQQTLQQQQTSIAAWTNFLDESIGKQWIEQTHLKRVIGLANGKTKWVCATCYQKRWQEQQERVYINSVVDQEVLSAPPHGDQVSIQSSVEEETIDEVNTEILECLQSIHETSTMKAVSKRDVPMSLQIARFLREEGISTLSHLLFVDFLWHMEYDYDQVSRFLLLRGPKQWKIMHVQQVLHWIQQQRKVIDDTSLSAQRALCEEMEEYLVKKNDWKASSTTFTNIFDELPKFSNLTGRASSKLAMLYLKYSFLEEAM